MVAIIDADGNPKVQYTYDAWGKILSISGPMADTLGAVNPLTYRGYVYDTETDLYYLQSRYYDPAVGRFINSDVFASTGQGFIGFNMLSYCNNNPVKYIDSKGYYPLETALDFLFNWLIGDEDEENYSEGSSIVNRLKESKKMQTYIEDAIDNYESGQSITTGYGEFTAAEDGTDLYLSTQHFDYTITVTKETRTASIFSWQGEVTRYTATVTVHDTYNFDSYRAWNSFGNILNNIAYAYHTYVGGNDFEWFATYTYSTPWTIAN